MKWKPAWPLRAMMHLIMIGMLATMTMTCLFPTGDEAGVGVQVYELETIQRLETLEGYAAAGLDGVDKPEQCDSTVTEGAPAITCRWRVVPNTHGVAAVEPTMPFRLGDRVIVRARVGPSGARGTEVLMRVLGEGQRGPSALRFVADTIDLLSVGETRLAVYAAGHPDVEPDTLVLFTYPARLPPRCGTPSTTVCTLDSLLIGEALVIPGGPFAVVRDPATGVVMSVLPEPSVTIGGLPAPVLERNDTFLRVAIPAGAGSAGGELVRVTLLGLPAVCTQAFRTDACYRPQDYAFPDWDVLEPRSPDLPTELELAPDDSVLAAYPSLALEGKATPWALDAMGRAHDWYTFTLDQPAVVHVELISVVPLDVRLSDTLAWDGTSAQARVVPGGWAVGSRPACQGVELPLTFPEADRGGTKRITAPLAAGRYHLVVSSTEPLPSMVGYGLRLTTGGPAPSDDSRCESAVPFVGSASNTLDGAFDVDWYVTTPSESAYVEFVASNSLGEKPSIAVLRDRLPDSLPIIAQGDGRSVPLLPPERHLIALLGNGRRLSYTLTSQPTSWGPPASLDLVGVPASAAMCDAQDVTVTVRDKLGNPVKGYGGTVMFSASDQGASLPAAYAFTAADSGRHRFADAVAFRNEGTATLTVSEIGAPWLAGTATLTVTPPTLRAVATPAVATVGVGMQVAFTTTVLNTCGTPVNAPVTWASVNPARATMVGNTATGVTSGQVALRADAGDRPTYVHLTVTAPRPTTPLTWDSIVGTTPGENLRSVWAAGPNAVWAVGTPGLIMAFDGNAWTTVRTGSPGDTLFGVWGAGPSDVWAVGTGGTALHFDGSSWSAVETRTPRTLRSVWGASPDDVWVVGDASRVLHYDGLTFETVPVPDHPGVNHFTVWGRTPTDVWIGGDEGTVRRFDGVTLTTLLNQPDRTIQTGAVFRIWVPSVWGVDPTNMQHWNECRIGTDRGAIACLDQRPVRRWNGTTSWDEIFPITPDSVAGYYWGLRIFGTNASEAWYATTAGIVVGAGDSWTTLLSRATSPVWDCPLAVQQDRNSLAALADAFVSLPGDVWAVGTCNRGTPPVDSYRHLILRGRY